MKKHAIERLLRSIYVVYKKAKEGGSWKEVARTDKDKGSGEGTKILDVLRVSSRSYSNKFCSEFDITKPLSHL